MENEILRFIPRGRRNAISMKQLSILTGWTLRETRAAIYRARCAGALICSSCDRFASGYFQPANREEVERFVKLEESRIKSAAKAVRSARQYLKAKEGGSNEA